MIVNRSEFRKIWNGYKPGLGDWNSPLWMPEENHRNKKSRWFACIPPIYNSVYNEFRMWCVTNCRGQVLCYSSNCEDQEEWYGFTHKPDIMLFMLKWS